MSYTLESERVLAAAVGEHAVEAGAKLMIGMQARSTTRGSHLHLWYMYATRKTRSRLSGWPKMLQTYWHEAFAAW